MFLRVTSPTYLTTSPVAPDTLSDDEKVFFDKNSELEIVDYQNQGIFCELKLKYSIKNTYIWFVRTDASLICTGKEIDCINKEINDINAIEEEIIIFNCENYSEISENYRKNLYSRSPTFDSSSSFLSGLPPSFLSRIVGILTTPILPGGLGSIFQKKGSQVFLVESSPDSSGVPNKKHSVGREKFEVVDSITGTGFFGDVEEDYIAEFSSSEPEETGGLSLEDYRENSRTIYYGNINIGAGVISGADYPSDIAGSNYSDTSQSPSFLLRYPNLDCPDKVLLNQRFSLTVELLIEQPEKKTEVQALMVEDKKADSLPEIEVVLSANGFDLEGSNTQIIQVERSDDSNARFVLVPSKLGQHKVKVQFYQNGKPIGKAVRNILVSEQPVMTEVSQPDQPTEIELNNGKIPPQDLELFIELDEDDHTLSFLLHSVKEKIGYRRAKVGKVILKGSPLEKMQSIYEKMNQYAKTKPTTTEGEILAEKRIQDIGNDLWEELIPDQLKQEYWKFKDRVKSIMINSDEPWIPWEMLKPFRYNNEDEREDDLFWCQQFSVSRWLSGAGTVGEFLIKTARPIAPKEENLPSLKDEITFLEQLSSLRPNINSLATFNTPMQVLDSLKNEDLSIIHFACHGAFDSISPNNSAIKLSDGLLYPSDIQVRFGGKRQRPLIFIIACHGGRTEFNFTGLGGWADSLLNARAGAFIGAMWEVSDRLSLQFTKTFYTALIQDNKTIADAFRQAREAIRQEAPYNSTWLAYTLYADPEGRVKP